jgi:hypothetical protein
MNNYYTRLANEIQKELFELRSAHTMWYVYAKKDLSSIIRETVRSQIKKESELSLDVDNYDFEGVMDECGFHYNEELPILTLKRALWKVYFD